MALTSKQGEKILKANPHIKAMMDKDMGKSFIADSKFVRKPVSSQRGTSTGRLVRPTKLPKQPKDNFKIQ